MKKRAETTDIETKTTALVAYDDELAQAAEAAVAQERHVGGGSFFSIRGGQLRYNDAQLPGNQVAVVIVDSVLENTYYEDAYDPDTPNAPTCYAFGRDDETMGPHEESSEPQGELCCNCPQNQWGSAERGRAKACRNRRRLALVAAGTFDRNGDFTPTIDDLTSASEVAYLSLPPTSIKSYAGYVKQLASTLKLPPHGVITRVAVEPDPKTQFRVVFELMSKVPTEVIPTCIELHKSQSTLIEFPYQKPESREAKPAAPTGKRVARKY